MCDKTQLTGFTGLMSNRQPVKSWRTVVYLSHSLVLQHLLP